MVNVQDIQIEMIKPIQHDFFEKFFLPIRTKNKIFNFVGGKKLSDAKTNLERKLTEYGMFVLNDYPMHEENQHVYILEEMILFLNFYDNSLAISFNVRLKPETAAQNILILEEIKRISKIDIMDSYMINSQNKVVSGEAAYELLEKSNKAEVLIEHLRDEQYTRILEKSKCFEC